MTCSRCGRPISEVLTEDTGDVICLVCVGEDLGLFTPPSAHRSA